MHFLQQKGDKMKTDEIKKLLASEEYDFLRTDTHLGRNIIILGLGGSYSYGTNNENSDLDIRGCALNSKRDILCGEDFEQIADTGTDTVIYSFNKLIDLLTGCNPNTIEILGLKPEHYLYVSDVGRELIDNREMFLSKKAAKTFGGYADAMFRRLDNKSGRLADQTILEEHILKSINNAAKEFPEMYFQYPEDAVRLYIDKAVNPELDSEIFMDISLKHYPLRDYKEMWGKMAEIVRSYGKTGKRNHNAIIHNKLSKHMTHLLRLFVMCIDILERGEIITYREAEHSLLMKVREGGFLDDNGQPLPGFFDIVDDYRKRMDYALRNTELPEQPDIPRIKDFVMSVNERIVKE